MKTTHTSLIGIAILMITALAMVIVGHHNIVQANDEGCNASTIQGVYGFALSGLASQRFNGDTAANWRIRPSGGCRYLFLRWAWSYFPIS